MAGMLRDGKQMIKIGAKRTLYRYSEKELQELACEVKAVDSKTKEIGVIFNNNSGGDAAENALALQKY